MFVAKADELKGITAIDEYFVRAPQQPGGARGSGTRPNSVGAGGSGRGQATSSAAHTSAPTVAAPTRNESAGDLLTAIVDVAGSVVDSAAQVMTGAVSSGLSLLADAYASDEEGEKQTVIDVEAESKAAELQRKKELQTKWTGKVWNGEAHQFEDVGLPESLVHGIESIINEKTSKRKQVRTSWSQNDKKIIVAVFEHLNRRKCIFRCVCRDSYGYTSTMRHMRVLT